MHGYDPEVVYDYVIVGIFFICFRPKSFVGLFLVIN